MATELRVQAHTILADRVVIEIWFKGVFVGQITAGEFPGVRITSKYDVHTLRVNDLMTEVRIKAEGGEIVVKPLDQQ